VHLPTLTRGPAPATGVAASGTAAGWAGVVAAAVALATTELVGGLVGSGPPLVPAVGSRIIDLGAGSLKDFAVSVFGTNDKPALVIGIVLVCLLAGWGIGRAARRHRWAAPVGFATFAVIGFAAAVGRPLTSPAGLAVQALAGTCAGLLTLQVLLGLATRAADPESTTPVSDRRRFMLTAGGAAALAALAAVAGRQMRSTRSVSEARAQVKLPAPTSSVAVPAAQPFDVPGLSSYVTPNADFYRIDTALLVPLVDVTGWQLSVTGLVDRPFSLGFEELAGMGMIEAPVTLACVSNAVGGDLVGNAVWRGVPLRSLLERAGVRSEATQIVGRSVDGFTVGFPTATALDGRTAMVAIGMNGRPLPISHGFPARLVVAGLYGYVSATKWLSEIEMTRLEDFDAYWIPRGWAKEGPIKTESRIDVPAEGAKLPAGTRTIAGVAWAPSRGISRVEVQVDGGTWRDAELGRVASANTWVQWLYRWPASPGRHRITVRATDATGAVQTAERRPPAPDGASGYHTRQVDIT
jgi:DMSO/TMAO reductase YedYZ molybdopterin-dependent catalytic subunit